MILQKLNKEVKTIKVQRVPINVWNILTNQKLSNGVSCQVFTVSIHRFGIKCFLPLRIKSKKT